MAEFSCPLAALHRAWDNGLAPALTIDAGDSVVFTTVDASNGVIPAPSWSAAAPSRTCASEPSTVPPGHPLCGPIVVRGAHVGDTLVVDILSIVPHEWGWTTINPVSGLLGAEIAERHLVRWDLRGPRAVPRSDDGDAVMPVRVPIEPFCGVMGVAPVETGELSTIPPRNVGGNMDVRHLVVGTTLLLPIAVDGALFSVGDVHAAQGDGEVSGTGIECAATVTLRFGVRRGRRLTMPEYHATRPPVRGAHYGVLGVAPDLMTASQNAVRGMIDYLEAEHELSRPDAYILCSAAVDLAISEVVDPPNWIVSAQLPLDLFGNGAPRAG